MFVYVCVNAGTGAFLNVFSTSGMASEYRRSVEDKVGRGTITILKAEVNALNAWQVYYEDEA